MPGLRLKHYEPGILSRRFVARNFEEIKEIKKFKKFEKRC
jgi:hypothetical protein